MGPTWTDDTLALSPAIDKQRLLRLLETWAAPAFEELSLLGRDLGGLPRTVGGLLGVASSTDGTEGSSDDLHTARAIGTA